MKINTIQHTPRFKTKAGRLTPYALACGYLEQEETPGKVQTTLWQECPGLYSFHVRQHAFNGKGRVFWETFERLTDARRFYDRECRKARKMEGKA